MSNADFIIQFNSEEPADESATSNADSSFLFKREEPAKEVGTIEPELHDPLRPHYSFESATSNGNTYISQDSTVPSSEIRASADTVQSVTVPQTPDTPSTSTSTRVTGKELGTHGASIINPIQPLGRPVWFSRTDSFGEDVTNSARSSTGRVAGRSLTDPFGTPAVENIKSGGIGDESGYKTSRSPEFPNVGPLKQESLNLGKSSDRILGASVTSLSRGNQGPEHGSGDDRTMSPISPANTIISGPTNANNKEKRVEVTDTSCQTASTDTINIPVQQHAESVASITHPSQNISEKDFQNAFKAGVPSNRLKLEDEAETERLLKDLSKEDYVAYRVSLGHPPLAERLLIVTSGCKTSQENQYGGRLLQRDR